MCIRDREQAMKHLTGLDAAFLHLETPEMPMHVGSLSLVELPAGYAGDYYEAVKAHVASRMHLAEVFHRKLALMPFELANPVWVEDEDVDLDYHVRRIVLSKPGSFRQLEQYVARLHSTLLDRSRPLWEIYVFEGLESGAQAVYTKVHHAGIDGQAGVALAKALMDVTPEPRQVKPPRPKLRRNRYQLGVAELAAAGLRNTVRQLVAMARSVPPVTRALAGVALPQLAALLRRRAPEGKRVQLVGPRTLFNVSITNQRTFAGRSIPLAETKEMAKHAGVTLNDVVLATCAGALRRYLDDHDALPKKPLKAAVPVSLRAEGDTEANNQVSMTLMTLATDVADPLERLQAIHEGSRAAKDLFDRVRNVMPTDFPSLGAPWIMSGLASLYGRSQLADRLPPLANVAISNVPGPQFPLYFAGGRLTTYYPVSIPAHGVALNITVQSYDGKMEYGLIACRRAVPDVYDLADYVVKEHERLRELVMRRPAAGEVAAAAATKPTRKPARGNGAARKGASPVAMTPAPAAQRASREPRAARRGAH
ncbi:MAG: wax ester/triacylglycerol synthase family O-acyltransferase, partial [Burkholderiales bacterium]|nr:wax ester/triacylglycerol synthase family O-acyltransferase [Burkholderiales bacterium]